MPPQIASVPLIRWGISTLSTPLSGEDSRSRNGRLAVFNWPAII